MSDMGPCIIDTCVITEFWAKNDEIVLSVHFFIHRHLIPHWNGNGSDKKKYMYCYHLGLKGEKSEGGGEIIQANTGRIWAPYGYMGQCDKGWEDLPGGQNSR